MSDAVFTAGLISGMLTCIVGEFLVLQFVARWAKLNQAAVTVGFGYYCTIAFYVAAFISLWQDHRLEGWGCSFMGAASLAQSVQMHREYRRGRRRHPSTGESDAVDVAPVEAPAGTDSSADSGDQGNADGKSDP